MKRLITLISTKGKSSQQVYQELKQNLKKYQAVSKQRVQPKPLARSNSSKNQIMANKPAEIYFTPNYSRGPKKYSQKQANPSWAQELSDNLRRNLLREDEDPNYNPPL